MDPNNICDARLVPVWNLQRSFRIDRAETIAKAKLKRPDMGFPGVISIYELAGASAADGRGFRAIIDGQHRVVRRRRCRRHHTPSLRRRRPVTSLDRI